MGTLAGRQPSDADGQMEFFGFHLCVKSPRLAALLSGDEDRVRVVRTGEEAPAASRPQACGAAVIWRSARREASDAVVEVRRLTSDP
jgi:hypothetical protein